MNLGNYFWIDIEKQIYDSPEYENLQEIDEVGDNNFIFVETKYGRYTADLEVKFDEENELNAIDVKISDIIDYQDDLNKLVEKLENKGFEIEQSNMSESVYITIFKDEDIRLQHRISTHKRKQYGDFGNYEHYYYKETILEIILEIKEYIEDIHLNLTEERIEKIFDGEYIDEIKGYLK